ncbi:hypothetical protein QY888_09395 [Latilactobacillus sakei]
MSIKESFVIFAIFINLSTFLVTYGSGKLAGFSKKKALIFALLYGLSIYRFADLVNRQAIGEVIALTFFPLVIVMMTRLKSGKHRALVLASCGDGCDWLQPYDFCRNDGYFHRDLHVVEP